MKYILMTFLFIGCGNQSKQFDGTVLTSYARYDRRSGDIVEHLANVLSNGRIFKQIITIKQYSGGDKIRFICTDEGFASYIDCHEIPK